MRGRTVNVAVDECDAAGSVLGNESVPDYGLTDVLHVHAHVGLHVLGDVQLRSRMIGEGAGRERDADDGVTKRQPRAHYVVARTPEKVAARHVHEAFFGLNAAAWVPRQCEAHQESNRPVVLDLVQQQQAGDGLVDDVAGVFCDGAGPRADVAVELAEVLEVVAQVVYAGQEAVDLETVPACQHY